MEYETPRYGFKEMPCRECGTMMTVGIRRRKPPRHIECGVLIAIAAQRQMHERSGPYYEKWAQSMVRLGSQMEGGGDPHIQPPGDTE